MSPGVNFTPKAANRISAAVREVESRPYPVNVSQRRRAGGLGRSTLWEVTAVQTTPKTCTIQRVENQDGDLIAPSEKTDILYDPDNEPSVGDRGLLIRLGEGSLFFFKRGADIQQIHRVTWAGWSQIRLGTPGGTFEINQAASNVYHQANTSSKRIVVVEFDEDEGLSVPDGGKIWFQVCKPSYQMSTNDATVGENSMSVECNVWFIKNPFDYSTITYTTYLGLSKTKVLRWISSFVEPGGTGKRQASPSNITGSHDELLLSMFLLPGDKIFSADTYYGYALELNVFAFAGCTLPYASLQFFPANYENKDGSHMDVLNSVSQMIDSPGVYRGEPI